MASLRKQNTEKNRQRILKAARALILESGIDALSVRKLAQESGLALRTIYNLYGNKENVVLAVLEHGTQGIEMALDKLEKAMCQGEWKTEYYVTVMQAMEQVFLENRDLLVPAMQASASLIRIGSGSAQAMHKRRIQKFRNTLEVAAEKGLIWGDLDFQVVAHLLYQGYFNVATQWAMGDLDDREFVVHGRYRVLTILHTLINEPNRRERTLELLRELKEFQI